MEDCIDLTWSSDEDEPNQCSPVFIALPVKKEPPAGSRFTPKPGPRRSHASSLAEIRAPHPVISRCGSTENLQNGLPVPPYGLLRAQGQPVLSLLAEPDFPRTSSECGNQSHRPPSDAAESENDSDCSGNSQESHFLVQQDTVMESLAPTLQVLGCGEEELVPFSTSNIDPPLLTEEDLLEAAHPPVQVRLDYLPVG